MANLFYLAQQVIDPSPLPQPAATSDTFAKFLTILFTTIGAVAFLLLVIAGFRYVISAGDAQKAAEARRQIIYVAIGLILAASADAIVTFIIGKAQ
jgi:hypothetical protein